MSPEAEAASSGHQLGQLIGDWWEEAIARPLMGDVGKELGLFVDSRHVERECRGGKILWPDDDQNFVDYDFVLELDGTTEALGIPVGFIESFWRRGARHSRDKARDDAGKLAPMRDTYPTARFLGVLACGDFSEPARTFLKSQQIEVFYVPKSRVIEAFANNGLTIDYPDGLHETEKNALVERFRNDFRKDGVAGAVAHTLRALVGQSSFDGFVSRVRSQLSALPQEMRFIVSSHSRPVVFSSMREASEFLARARPPFDDTEASRTFVYEISYSDATEFKRELANLDELRELHSQITRLADHMQALASNGKDGH